MDLIVKKILPEKIKMVFSVYLAGSVSRGNDKSGYVDLRKEFENSLKQLLHNINYAKKLFDCCAIG